MYGGGRGVTVKEIFNFEIHSLGWKGNSKTISSKKFFNIIEFHTAAGITSGKDMCSQMACAGLLPIPAKDMLFPPRVAQAKS